VDRKNRKVGHQFVILYSFRPPDVSEMRNSVAFLSFNDPLDFQISFLKIKTIIVCEALREIEVKKNVSALR
jgi:transcription termination factor Rho